MCSALQAHSYFLLNMEKFMRLNSQQPKTRGHVEHPSALCYAYWFAISKKYDFLGSQTLRNIGLQRPYFFLKGCGVKIFNTTHFLLSSCPCVYFQLIFSDCITKFLTCARHQLKKCIKPCVENCIFHPFSTFPLIISLKDEAKEFKGYSNNKNEEISCISSPILL